MKGIPVSLKHGLNPSLGVCFFCGEETGEIVLNGKIKNDIEAPKYMVTSYTPCKKCQEHIKDGVGLIEVTNVRPEDGRPIISKANAQHPDIYPTGKLAVITLSAAKEVFGDDSLRLGEVLLTDTALFQDLIKAGEFNEKLS